LAGGGEVQGPYARARVHRLSAGADERPEPASRTLRSAFRDRLAAEAATLLEPGEEVQAVIWAQTIPASPTPLTVLRLLARTDTPYRVIVATDRRLLLCRGGRRRGTGQMVGEVYAELPRETLLGPASGASHPIDFLGEPLHVPRI